MSTEKAFWEDDVTGFAKAEKSDDLLHPEMSKDEPRAELTETQYLGFNIPGHGIHAIGYLWYHPNLKTVMGGLAVWQGFKKHPLQSEIWDYISYMNDACLENDLWRYRLDNGYAVTTIEPLSAHRIQYEDSAADSMVDVRLDALTPPVMLSTGMHFEQPMKTSGEIRLRGKVYKVDGTTVRDRSFGQLRREYHVPLPPLAWMNAAFSENFAFSCTAFDDPSREPTWSDVFQLPNGNPLRGGWIYKDGETSQIVEASKTTVRKKENFHPERIEMTLRNQQGRVFEVVGKSNAGVNWRTWHNMDSNINLMQWECDGQVTHGDYQEFLWPEYVRRFHP